MYNQMNITNWLFITKWRRCNRHPLRKDLWFSPSHFISGRSVNSVGYCRNNGISYLSGGRTAQWIKMIATEFDDQSLISKVHMMGKEWTPTGCPLIFTHTWWHLRAHTHTRTHILNKTWWVTTKVRSILTFVLISLGSLVPGELWGHSISHPWSNPNNNVPAHVSVS